MTTLRYAFSPPRAGEGSPTAARKRAVRREYAFAWSRGIGYNKEPELICVKREISLEYKHGARLRRFRDARDMGTMDPVRLEAR